MKAAAFGLLLLVHPLAGQTPSVVTSVGYSAPEPATVAPGQVITLFARTKARPVESLTATGPVLPTALGGFSVVLAQTFAAAPLPIPILSVRPVEGCFGLSPTACTSSNTAISVQIPFELAPNTTGARLPENFASLTVVDNGVAGEPMPLHPVSDQIHILNSCDTPLTAQSSSCRPLLLHADESPVTTEKPALPGETLILYAYGLGLPETRIGSGAASPSPAISVAGVSIDFRFGASSALLPPGTTAGAAAAELVPGSIGLYRVSFGAPAAPAGTPACSAISSNASVAVGRAASFDGVGFCLYVPAPAGVVQPVPPRGRR